MAHRSAQIIQIDITRPDSEQQAIKNADLSALLGDGWEIAYGWIKTVSGEAGDTTQSYLLLVMVPPSPGVSDEFVSMAQAERSALASVLESQTKGNAALVTRADGLYRLGLFVAAVFVLTSLVEFVCRVLP